MGYYTFLFFIPVLMWIAFSKLYFKNEFTYKEMISQGVVSLAVIFGVFSLGSHYQTYDTKLVNGVVTELNPRRENCKTGWSDFKDGFCTEYRTRQVPNGQTCTTNSNGVRICTTNYKTQYNYIYSWERRYFVETDINEGYEIKRIDRQGKEFPPRFTEIKIGDPVTDSISYTNYIRAATDSLFNDRLPSDELPPLSYPTIRDYYKANRVIIFGVEFDSNLYREWNDKISILNSNIRKSNANVIIVITGESQEFADKLAQAWEAHNINDVIVSIGINNNSISWTDVRSWSSNELINVSIRDEILNLSEINVDIINEIISSNIMMYYSQKDMSEFEYLADDIPPPFWAMILAFLILFVISPIVTVVLSKNQIKS
jgi:hypothetical protein